MSTILDALKRVQRDREHARPLDLRESVTAAGAPLRRKRRGRSWLRPVLIALFALGAGVMGYQRGKPLFAHSDDNVLELALAAPPPEPGLGAPAPAPDPTSGALTPAEPIAAESPSAAMPDGDPEPQPVTVPEPPQSYPIAQSAPRRAPRVARRVPGQGGAPDVPALGAVAGESTAPSQPVAAAPPALSQPSAARAARAPVGRPATRTYPSLPRRLPSRDVARVPEGERDEGAVQAPEAQSVQRADTEFPEIRVANVVWHPVPSRRRAEVTIEETRLADAREGDIVKGVEVEKIEPGAVEFKLGSALKTVRIGP